MNLISQLLPLSNVIVDLDVASKKRVFEQAGLLFENTGTDFPLLINSMGSYKRMCMAIGVDDLDDVAYRAIAVDREAKELGQLADQHRERDAVHVAVADRLRQQLGYETQSHLTNQDAH